jgi:hypothetical protein
MEEQRHSGRRRRGMVAGLLAAVAMAVALPASGALAGDSSPNSQASGSGVESAPVQDRRDQEPRDRDCPEKRDGQGGASGSEDAIEL